MESGGPAIDELSETDDERFSGGIHCFVEKWKMVAELCGTDSIGKISISRVPFESGGPITSPVDSHQSEAATAEADEV